MSVQSCKQKAEDRFKAGLVKKVDVSFKCYRKNELMKKNGLDHSSAWDRALKESIKLFGI